jgi:hypothetical protein
MKAFLAWWYRVSLPQREPDTTPAERERTRYARLTAAFLLVLFPLGVLTTTYGVLTSINPAAPIIEMIAFSCLLFALICNKLGYNIAAALFLIMNISINSVGNMLTNPLDPVFTPILCSLVIAVVLAGSLTPPIYALLVALLNCGFIVYISFFYHPHSAAYDHWLSIGYGSLLIGLPIAMQIIVAVVTFAIMNNLITTIRRADRAEEIVALQKEIVEYQRRRNEEREHLERGITSIAQAYSAIANGDLETRVQVPPESVLWQVVAPLNTLLNRAQHWKQNADQWEKTLLAIRYVRQELQRARGQQTPATFPQPTETPVDLLIPEVYMLSQQAYKAPPARSDHL